MRNMKHSYQDFHYCECWDKLCVTCQDWRDAAAFIVREGLRYPPCPVLVAVVGWWCVGEMGNCVVSSVSKFNVVSRRAWILCHWGETCLVSPEAFPSLLFLSLVWHKSVLAHLLVVGVSSSQCFVTGCLG